RPCSRLPARATACAATATPSTPSDQPSPAAPRVGKSRDHIWGILVILDRGRSPVNTGAPFPEPKVAEERVLHFQRKLHEWASNDDQRRFCDLWNLVCDPAALVVAWSRVSRNRGSRTAGIDGATRRHVEQYGVERFLWELRGELKSGAFRPLPVRERMIPKRDGRKLRT